MTDSKVRLSSSALRVLKVFIDTPREARSGAEITKLTLVGAGTLYPLLVRLQTAGWLTSDWENIDPAEAGRPKRKFYRITGLGQTKAREALAPVQFGSGALQWT